MTELMMQPLANYIKKHGGTVRTSSKVDGLLIQNNSVSGVICGSDKILANHVVVATSLADSQKLLKPHFADHPGFKSMLDLPSMPAVTCQIDLHEPSLPQDRTTFSPGTSLSSYAEQSRTTFKGQGRLSVILSNPEQALSMDSPQILDVLLQDAKRININLQPDSIKDYRVIRWPHDFYSYTSGTYFARPESKTAITGLVLAGDYTAQPYLSTMEGAVESGNRAAQVITGQPAN